MPERLQSQSDESHHEAIGTGMNEAGSLPGFVST
jgi:hypothetical protein